MPGARNPLFFQGQPVETCQVSVGRHFVLGQTSFRLSRLEADTASTGESPVEEVAFTHQELQKVRYQDPDNRLEVLTHLPEVIAGARDERELYHRLVNLLEKGSKPAGSHSTAGPGWGNPDLRRDPCHADKPWPVDIMGPSWQRHRPLYIAKLAAQIRALATVLRRQIGRAHV